MCRVALYVFLHICVWDVRQMCTLVGCDHEVGAHLVYTCCSVKKRHQIAMSGALWWISRQIFHFYSLNVCKQGETISGCCQIFLGQFMYESISVLQW